jgi:AraC-like DNA-binding protein
MLNVFHVPSPPLSDFIERFWAFGDSPPHARERIIPSGTFELVINLREDEIRIYDPIDPALCTRHAGAVVSGAFRGFFIIDTREHASIMGVHFKPGGAYPFLGSSAHELADAHVDLRALWGPRVGDLRERLCELRTVTARFALLETVLRERLVRPAARRGAVQLGLACLGGTPIRDVVDRVGLSHKRFVDLFTREVGMTPKLFSRVRRFQRAIALAQGTSAPHWARLAQDCGYFDQSHLVRDFRAFAGVTPDAYLDGRTSRVKDNHIPVGAGTSKSSNTATPVTSTLRFDAEPEPLQEASWNRSQ